MRVLLILTFLLIFSARALGAPTEDLGEKNYSGSNAGYLVMSFGRSRSQALAVFDHFVELSFQKLDHSLSGTVRHGVGSKADYSEAGNEGVVFVRALPPGEYEFFYIRLEGLGGIFQVRYSLPFAIRSRQATYIGSLQLLLKDQLGALGGVTVAGYFVRLSDQSTRDLEIAHRKSSATAGPSNVEVPDPASLRTPLFSPEPDLRPISPDSYLALQSARFEFGLRETTSKNYEGAIAKTTKAIEAGDLWPYLQADAYTLRGIGHLGLRHYDDAIADFTSALAFDRFHYDAFDNRGLAYSDRGDLDRALADHAEALRGLPDSATVRLHRALTYTRMRRFEFALDDVNLILQRDSKYARAYAERGAIYALMGRMNEAFADYASAIKFEESSTLKADFLRARGDLYLSVDRNAEAADDFLRVIGLGRAGAGDYARRCYALVANGNARAGLGSCDRALQMDAKSLLARNAQGIAYLQQGKYPQSIADFTEAIRINQRFPMALFGRGVAKVKSGDTEGGTVDMNEALGIDREIVKKAAKLGITP